MTTLSFDSDNTLSGALFGMTPREAITLGIQLCEQVERSVGADGCHGNIWPGNISCANGQTAIGPAGNAGITELSPEALEYVSPEQFWSGECKPASDVYSIGLVLYTALNGGVMPFFTPDGERNAAARASALQNRMKGRVPAYPAAAGRELGDVVLKALSFKAEDRYPTPGQLKAALQSLPEEAAIPAVAPVIHMTEQEVRAAHSYKVDKDFENIPAEKPKKKKRVRKDAESVDENMDAVKFRTTPKAKRWVVPVIVIAVIAVAAVLLLRGCGKDSDAPEFPVVTEPAATPDAIHPPVPDDTQPTATPVETEPPAETEAPDEPRYEIRLADVTWAQAKDLAEQAGGHLATVRSQEQLDSIISLAEANGASFVWLGAYRDTQGKWTYVTGDEMLFSLWDEGEPSAMDNDGTREDYLLLWYRKAIGRWTYNDMRNDPISVVPKTYSGKTAYVIQFDE